MGGFPGFAIACAAALAVLMPSASQSTEFDLRTATIAEMSAAMDAGALTSERLVSLSLARIRAYDPKLHAVISLNPEALRQARALDAERRAKGPRSPLHGIPILVKDNVNTRDLPTTLGFYGLKGVRPLADAAVVTRLRAAGAIVLAKVNLSELASGPPLSSMGGQTLNPYDPARSPAGSSSGSAVGVAAGYAALSIATDTTGSARWPAATSGVVGLRPTAGIVSSVGVQPNAPTLDTVGAIARSTSDAALALSLLQDVGHSPVEGRAGLSPDALRGARIGFPRRDFSGDDPAVDAVVAHALDALRAAGATVIEVELPPGLVRLGGDLQSAIIRTESAPALDGYLAGAFGDGAPHSHAELLAMSETLTAAPPPGATANPGRLAGYRGEAAAPSLADPAYRAARDQGRAYFRASLQAVLAGQTLDAIVYPTQTARINRLDEAPKRNARGVFSNFGGAFAALAGWPELTVPAGVTPDGLPVGLSFLGPEFADDRILGYGYAFEQRVHDVPPPPATTPPLPGERFVY